MDGRLGREGAEPGEAQPPLHADHRREWETQHFGNPERAIALPPEPHDLGAAAIAGAPVGTDAADWSDPSGRPPRRLVQVDDPRLNAVWDSLETGGIPVLLHSADPQAGWRAPDPASPHYRYFQTHPAFYPFLHPEMPTWGSVIGARDRWLSAHPNLIVIGAHLGSMADDLPALSRRLDSYPNFNVDLAARLQDLQRQPVAVVRQFFLTYQDRILWGTDYGIERDEAATSSAELRREEQRLVNRVDAWQGYLSVTLHLPTTVLEKVYFLNARRLLHLTGRS